MSLHGRTDHIVIVHGVNTAVGTTALYLDDSAAVALTPFPAAATLLEVASSSTDDVKTSGTGAWTLRVFGLGEQWQPQTEDFDLNGQTVKTSVKKFIRIFGAEVRTAGTGLVNAGVISVADDSASWASGVPTGEIFTKMAVGLNATRCGIWTVPANWGAYRLVSLAGGSRGQVGDVRVVYREFGGVIEHGLTFVLATSGGNFSIPADAFIIEEKTDIALRGIAGSSGATIGATAVFHRIGTV